MSFFLLIILILTLTQCFQVKKRATESLIDFPFGEVVKIELITRNKQILQVPKNQPKPLYKFLSELRLRSPTKVMACYRLNFYLKDGTKKTYKTNGRLISDIGSDWFCDLEIDFVEKFWQKGKANCLLKE